MANRERSTVVCGGLVFQPAGAVAAGDVWIQDGRIAAVTAPGATPPAATPSELPPGSPAGSSAIPPTVIDASGCLVLPGLIDAHFHSHGMLSRGAFPGAPLEIWTLHAAAGRARLDPDEVYTTCLLACYEFLRLGTTAVLDHCYWTGEQMQACAQAYVDAGLRVNIAPCLSDRTYSESLPLTPAEAAVLRPAEGKAPDPDDLIQLSEQLVSQWHGAAGGRIQVMAGSSAPQRCSEPLLRNLVALAARHGLGLHTHLVETRIQALTAQQFYGCTMTEYLERLGWLGPRTSLAHGVWLTQSEIARIAAAGSTVVHNPFPNAFLGSGIAPVADIRRAGAAVALGTDGPNCGGSMSLFEALRWSLGLQRLRADAAAASSATEPAALPGAAAALNMLWSGGAQALARSDIGALAPGHQADLVLMDTHSPAFAPANDWAEQLVFHASGPVRTVLIAGEVVFDGGQTRRFDGDAAVAKVQAMGPALQQRQQQHHAAAQAQAERAGPTLRRLWQECRLQP